MEQLIEQYIESKRLAWSPTTIRSEKYRLLSLMPYLISDNPVDLWTHLTTLGSYSRVTYWTRSVDFWNWLKGNGHRIGLNPYEKFRKENARLFKHAYDRRLPTLTFQEAVDKVSKLPDGGARNLALQILGSGTRFCEAIQGSDQVIGKGAKPRSVYRPETEGGTFTGSYQSFRRALKACGLKPHDLRKLCATRLADAGLTETDLLKVMGWTSMETAKFYLSPKKDDELRAVFGRIHKELK